jgi:hypothetical protein
MSFDGIRFRSKEILASKAMVVVVALAALVVSLSFVDLGWMLDDLYQRLLMRNTQATKEFVPDKFSFDPIKGFYVFIDKDPERTEFPKDKGLLP